MFGILLSFLILSAAGKHVQETAWSSKSNTNESLCHLGKLWPDLHNHRADERCSGSQQICFALGVQYSRAVAGIPCGMFIFPSAPPLKELFMYSENRIMQVHQLVVTMEELVEPSEG